MNMYVYKGLFKHMVNASTQMNSTIEKNDLFTQDQLIVRTVITASFTIYNK